MSNPITWETNAGSIGTYPAQVSMTFNIEASASTGYVITKYILLSGELSKGLSLRSDGKVYGTPDTVSNDTTSTFVVRAFATNDDITVVSDRTFTITITGAATPSLTIPSGSTLLQTIDSVWVEIPITYNNPISTNPVIIRILQGELPPGLEINTAGLIRGYPEPPINSISLPAVSTVAVATSATNNYVTVLSTANFSINRPIVFYGTSFGNINAGTIYYVKEVIDSTQITISTSIGASALTLQTENGYMDVSLPATSKGDPEKKIYTFTIELISEKGDDRAVYSITVINQQLPIQDGGPGLPENTRLPVMFNTRPPTYNIESDTENFGYYVLPPAGSVSPEGTTYTLSQQAYIGEFVNDNYFSFHLLGFDYDNKILNYVVSGLPTWATFDSLTGWIYGNPSSISINDIEEFSFTARVFKTVGGINYNSPDFKFTFKIANGITDNIAWLSDENLGLLYNASPSFKKVEALADVNLTYELTPNSNILPPNLKLQTDGQIVGIVSYQPNDNFALDDANNIFTFTVRAYNADILKTVSSDSLKANVVYFINQLGSTQWANVGATLVNAGNFKVGNTYLISNVGANVSQLTFIGANLVNAGNFVLGEEYIIQTIGDTNWNTLGVVGNATVNTIFTATGPGTGSGQVFETKFISTGVGDGLAKAFDERFISSGSENGTGSANTYLITSDKEFYLTINQHNNIPTDNLYIKCTPDAHDRNIIENLLTDTNIIPTNYLYRPEDINFGKAKDVTFVHAYGIHSSNLEEYIEATKKNHYWKDVTLGKISTAVAVDESNKLIYEIVYSNIIDNLLVYNPKFGIDYRYTESIPMIITWPRFIDLNLGPWYTSSIDIYTSYVFNQPAEIITNFTEYQLLTQDGLVLLTNGGIPTFYTSLTPGYAKILYPNSIDDMRERVELELGADYNFDLLPLWMTGQQLDGNTLGYTPAWVIAYFKPAEKITTAATQTYAGTSIELPKVVVTSTAGFVVGRPIVFTGNTFGNIVNGQVYYIKKILSNTEIVLSTSITYDSNNFPIPGPAYPLYDEEDTNFGSMIVTFDPISYAEIVRQNIVENWAYTLNEIDFEIDRFIVDKQLTYNLLTDIQPSVWYEYPSATPTPTPMDSKNFYVIFPRKTILPEKTQ